MGTLHFDNKLLNIVRVALNYFFLYLNNCSENYQDDF